MRAVACRHPRWGRKMAHRLLRREGYVVNRKAHPAPVAGGGAAPAASMPQAPSVRPDSPERLQATRPNHVWALDFQFDETVDQRRLKPLNIVDEFTRELRGVELRRPAAGERLGGGLFRLAGETGPR